MYCTQCGLDVGDEVNFCRRCGADLRGLRPGTDDSSTDAPSSDAPPGTGTPSGLPQAPPVSQPGAPGRDAGRSREGATSWVAGDRGVIDGPGGRVLVTPQGDLPVAGFALRLGGFLVDLVFYIGVALVLTIVIYGIDPDAPDETLTVASWLVIMVAEWYFNSVGWSPGRRAVGIRIVRESGERPGPGKGLARTVAALISGLAFALGYLWAAWDGKGQTWHDKMAETFVVRRVP